MSKALRSSGWTYPCALAKNCRQTMARIVVIDDELRFAPIPGADRSSFIEAESSAEQHQFFLSQPLVISDA